MTVAIIGAGLAGLSCAHELQRHGINPEIYETNSFIGEAYNHVGAALNIVVRSIGEPLKYLKDYLYLDIQPLNTVNKIIHHSPNNIAVIKGSLGFFVNRSKEPTDIKNQIFAKLQNPRIFLNTCGDYKLLSEKYDHVVIADGLSNMPNELGCWFEWINTFVKGAMIEGDFEPTTLTVWLNKDYCRNGYAYMAPLNNKMASIALVVNDVDTNAIDHYWNSFLETENLQYFFTDEFRVNHKSGYVFPHKYKNMYFAGNAGGAIDPFLGFGVMGSLTMGVMAARSIIFNKDYEKLIEPVTEVNQQLYQFRKVIDSADNSGYDRFMSVLNLPGVERLIYHTRIDAVKYGSYLLKLLSRFKKTGYII